MKNLIFISIFLSTIATSFGQQDPLVSMYMFNGLLINPAYAGTKPYVRSTLLHRSQWVGWKGAPMTDIITVDGGLKDNVSAIGLVASNDRAGVTNQADMHANYAYRIKLKPDAYLSFGLKAGLTWYSANLGDLTVWDGNDNVYAQGNQNSILPNVGVGAFYYSKKFYAGLSVPKILSYDPSESFSIGKDVNAIPNVRRHYYLTAGNTFVLSHAIALKPSILLRYVHSAPVGADFNFHVLLNQILWIGASYRLNDAAVAMMQLQVMPALRIGYAYDYTLTRVGNFSSGSHEIMLGYDLGRDIIKMKTPRYF